MKMEVGVDKIQPLSEKNGKTTVYASSQVVHFLQTSPRNHREAGQTLCYVEAGPTDNLLSTDQVVQPSDQSSSDAAFVQAVPGFTDREVTTLIRKKYDVLPDSIQALPGWVDKNYLVKTAGCAKTSSSPDVEEDNLYVLKVLNAKESEEVDYIDAQNMAMMLLKANGYRCSVPRANTLGLYNSFCRVDPNGLLTNPRTADNVGEDKGQYLVRLLSYVPGRRLDAVGEDLSADLLYETGRFIASINLCLQGSLHHPGLLSRRESIWHMESVPKLRGILATVSEHLDTDVKDIIQKVLDEFETNVGQNYSMFQKGLIHGDCNPGNILLLNQRPKDESGQRFGIIDFGEIGNSFILFELAILMAHFLVLNNSREYHISVTKLRNGFTAVRPLNSVELPVLQCCVAARLAQNVVISTWYLAQRSMDASLQRSNEQFQEVLKNFDTLYKL